MNSTQTSERQAFEEWRKDLHMDDEFQEAWAWAAWQARAQLEAVRDPWIQGYNSCMSDYKL